MAPFTIDLGSASALVKLFSYPNAPGSSESLADTISHWVNQMLARDGFAAKGANATVRVSGGRYVLELDGADGMEGYKDRLPDFLKLGLGALTVINKDIKGKKKSPAWPAWVKNAELDRPTLKQRLWDPLDRGNWRFFLPLGMAMVNQKMVNFFHYPPMRLLDQMRDYLADPVPDKLIKLLYANGVKTEDEAWLYSTVMDGAPIAAPDDEGTIYEKPGEYPTGSAHLLPIDKFHVYQRELTELLLNDDGDGYTVPVVVYGTSALKSFNKIWPKAKLDRRSKPATSVEILKGRKTAVLCSGHPYAFFAQVQTVVGAGDMKPEAWGSAVATMTRDLAVIRWQLVMAKSPEKDPASVWTECLEYWKDDKQLDKLYQLILHLGSLWYPDPHSLEFTYRMSMKDAEKRATEAANSERKARARGKSSKSKATKKKKSRAATTRKSSKRKRTKAVSAKKTRR